mmetsp:Transcript_50632/g.151395  ORF Transcript_50632/g.151395 Transcript_50632/m.151395 type:complete len:266 (+) Transcript_50632:1827-2624(+)
MGVHLLLQGDPLAAGDGARGGDSVLRPGLRALGLYEHDLGDLIRRQRISGLVIVPSDPCVQLRQLLLRHLRREDERVAHGGRLVVLREVAPICEVGEGDEHREKQEGDNALPWLNDVLGACLKDDQQPNVRKDGEEGGQEVDRQLLDPLVLTRGDSGDTDRDDAEEVERSAADNGRGSQVTAVELVAEELHDAEQDLGRARAQGHEREVRHGRVPDRGRVVALQLLAVLPSLLGSDDLDRPHEAVRDKGDPHETPEQSEAVEDNT